MAQPVVISYEPNRASKERSKLPLHSLNLLISGIIKIECAKVHVLCDTRCDVFELTNAMASHFRSPKMYNDDADAG